MNSGNGTRGLTKDFRVSGSNKLLSAVDELSLEIHRNSIYVLWGPQWFWEKHNYTLS